MGNGQKIDFRDMTDGQLIEFAEGAVGVYDGLRIYSRVNRHIPEFGAVESIWEQCKAEVLRRGLGDEIGL